jgi:dimethylsulfone monooxygenase
MTPIVEERRFTGALGNNNRLKLGTFSTNCERGGTITTMPGTLRAEWHQVKDVAQRADRMGLEAFVPVARWKGLGGVTNFNGPCFDTFAWAAGLAAATENAFIFSTCHVPTIHPIVAAKQLATVDHISGGRAGINVVGGWFTPELEMFGHKMLEHDRRYEMADEWTEIIHDLWTREEEFDFSGDFFNIRGGYSQPKPLQKPAPPIMNAGGSPRGVRYAAQFADLAYILVKEDDVDSARAQVQEIKRIAREDFHRDIQVWTYGYVVCRDTEQEALDYEEYYVVEKGDYVAADNLMHYVGLESQVLGNEAYEHYRHRFMAGWGGLSLVGTPEQIVDRLQMVSDIGCSGCLLLWPVWEEGLDQWGADVMPLLEQAGLREPYVSAAAPEVLAAD